MNRGEDLVTIGFAYIAVLHEEILGVLRKRWSREDAESWSTVVLEGSGLKLLVSEPSQIATIEFDVLGSNRERIVFRVSRVGGYLGRLDLGNDMKWCIVVANAEGDGKLATASGRVHGESSIAGGNEDGTVFSEPGWSQILAAAVVGKEAGDLGLFPLSGIGIVRACHDHC